ncbi:MAG: hypothetical protein M1814_002979 [Vezdaea aestivalis]|nr:MAG: hypothetical protein M1814_002979 [Vezdaea aestivalis]
MHSQLVNRLRRSSISAVPPPKTSSDYSKPLADLAAQIFFLSPLPSKDDRPIYILNASASDSKSVDFDELLPYILARLPDEDELIGGRGYEIVFFAGAGSDGPTASKRNRPGWGWFLQAYNTLNRATRKRLQRLYIVHERSWVRILVEMFSTIVSPKFRKKIYHEELIIPTSAYLQDRQFSSSIHAPHMSGRRAFSAAEPLPISSSGSQRLPRVLREASRFLLLPPNIETEGLFRIPPNAKILEVLREAYDRAQRFIIWKEDLVMLPQPAHEPTIPDWQLRDGFGPLLAAAIVKLWYRELRSPLVPSSAYKELTSLFGDASVPIDPARLIDLLSTDSEWSCLPLNSRQILTRHLLPLLHAVSEHSDTNKMTPSNLAVCLAPALLCSDDPVRDSTMGLPVRRVLDLAVAQWDKGLREVLGTSQAAFQADLLDPEDINDFEDPLKDGRKPVATHSVFSDSSTQLQGSIMLQDNDHQRETVSEMSPVATDNASVEPEVRPHLPPRQRQAASGNNANRSIGENASPVRRKPAPPLVVPPRYSMAFPDGAQTAGGGSGDNAPRYSSIIADSPSTYAVTTDGFRPSNVVDLDQRARGQGQHEGVARKEEEGKDTSQ